MERIYENLLYYILKWSLEEYPEPNDIEIEKKFST